MQAVFPHPLPATLHLATHRMAHSCGLSPKVDRLAAIMVQTKPLLLALQPGAGVGATSLPPGPPSVATPLLEDAMSLAAPAEPLLEKGGAGPHSPPKRLPTPLLRALCRARRTAPWRPLFVRPWYACSFRFRRPTQASAFFRHNPAPFTPTVLPLEEYLRELHAC